MNKYLNKFFTIILLFSINNLYSVNKTDRELLEEYSFIPKEATSIHVDKTLEGDFISYFIRCSFKETDIYYKKSFFLSHNGTLYDIEDQIKSVLLNSPEWSNIIDFEEPSDVWISNINSMNQSVGYIYFYPKAITIPFMWTPEGPTILQTLNYSNVVPSCISNNGVIVGYAYKNYTKTLYLDSKPITFDCEKRIYVIWINNSIKEICLLKDPKDKFSIFNKFEISIDEDDFVHFWYDFDYGGHAGSFHIKEIDNS